MIYKTFVWPNEPKTLKISLVNDSKTYILPEIGPTRKKTGFTYKIIEGTGEFFGPRCYENFQELSLIFNDSSPGKLVIPNFPPMEAFFDELSLVSETSPEIISYKFKFTEEPLYFCDQQELNKPNYYNVEKNENLWDIANKFNVSIDTLLKNNPEISNPYDIMQNLKVRIL